MAVQLFSCAGGIQYDGRMDDPLDEIESKAGLEKAVPLQHAGSLSDAISAALPNAKGPFWVTFFSLIFVSLYIPVFPLYMHNDVLMWVVPVWAVYVLGWIAPLLAVPIIVLHITICFYFARFSFPYEGHTRSISLLSMMLLVSVVCIFVAMSVRFYDIGFVVTFLVFAMSISAANLFLDSGFCGVVYPRLSQGVARVIFWLSCILTFLGLVTMNYRS